MKTTAEIRSAVFAAAVAATLGTSPQTPDAVAIDGDDIGGVVTGTKGPEAGVWVIAETTDLPTKFVRIVVTDDRGRYVVPDLPKANYDVWVRGYGLVDSPKVQRRRGKERQPDRGDRAGRARRRPVLSGGLLVLAAASPGEERVSRDRRQRHRAGHEEPGRLAPQP